MLCKRFIYRNSIQGIKTQAVQARSMNIYLK